MNPVPTSLLADDIVTAPSAPVRFVEINFWLSLISAEVSEVSGNYLICLQTENVHIVK